MDARLAGSIRSRPSSPPGNSCCTIRSSSTTRFGASPALASRVTFVRDRSGHFRSAYSPDAAIAGGITAWFLKNAARVDLDAPRAPNLVAVVTASATTALAVVLVFLTLARLTTPVVGLVVAIGLGLGTNLWALDSRTLAEHDLVALGMAWCLFHWTRAADELDTRRLVAGALGLALAETARFQLLPAVGVLVLGLVVRVGVRRALLPALVVAAAMVAFFAVEWSWFGNILGALPALERLHPQIHDVIGSYSETPWIGAAGLLVSPNRGVFVFSPIVLIAIAGIPAALRVFKDRGLGWAFAAALLEFVCYSLYNVWWGGHTYGPRYALDMLVLLAPAAGAALTVTLRARWARALVYASAGVLDWRLGRRRLLQRPVEHESE